MEPLDRLLKEIAEIISKEFNMRYVLVGLLNDDTGLFEEKALYGYSPEQLRIIGKRTYTLERVELDWKDEFKCGPRCYYVRHVERGIVQNDELDYFDNPEQVSAPRKSPEDWHPLDYIDFVLTDEKRDRIGWIELIEPRDLKVPTQAVLGRIQVFTDLAAIAIENAKAFENALKARWESEDYLDLISHDIANRLTPLIVYLERIESSGTLDPANAKMLKEAIRNSSSIKKLVIGARTMSRVRGERASTLHQVQLKTALNSCLADLKDTYPEPLLSIKTIYPEGDVAVLGDDLMYFLFYSLLENAIKFDPKPEKKITINVKDAQDFWRIEFEDNGRGIPDTVKYTIFKRSEDGEKGISSSGVGLSLVSLLTQRYRGAIFVKDRIPGDYSQGATFVLDLPKARSKE